MDPLFARQIIFLVLLISPLLYLVYRVRNKNLIDLGIYCGLLFVYIVIHREFTFGRQFAFHDTLWAHHAYYAIIHEWMQNGFAIGWNPFMNGGEPLYLYSNYFLWAEFVVAAYLNKVVQLPVHYLINIYFVYIFLSYFTFSFVLFSVFFKERSIVFFPLVALMFSGLTHNSMGQYMLSPLYFFPLLFLSIFLFLTRKNILYLFWAGFFLCVTTNHYLPQYLLVVFGFYMLSFGLMRIRWKNITLPGISGWDGKKIILILVLSLMVVSPALYVFMEIQDYVSPVRAGKALGEIKDFRGLDHDIQEGKSLNFQQYQYLLSIPPIVLEPRIYRDLKYFHSVYFIGIIPVFFFLVSFFCVKERSRNFNLYLSSLITLALLVYFSIGWGSALWGFFVRYIPFFLIRHAYPFSNIICFLVLILSTFGFLRLLKSPRDRWLVIIGVIIISYFPTAKIAEYNWSQPPFEQNSFIYPERRSLLSDGSVPIPFDTSPIIKKSAAAMHNFEGWTFFRNKAFHELLEKNAEWAVGDLFLFAEDLNDFPEPALKEIDGYNLSFEKWGKGPGGKALPLNFEYDAESTPLEKNSDPEFIWEGNASLKLDSQFKVPMMFKRKLFPLDSLRGNLVQFTMRIKSQSKIMGKVHCGLTEGVLPAEVILDYKNPGKWETITVSNLIPEDSGQVEISCDITWGADSPVYFDGGQLKYISLPPKGYQKLDYTFIKRDDPNHLKIQVNSPKEGFVIRKEVNHKGWQARINNIKTPILDFGGVYQAVKVPKGKSVIEFEFNSLYPWLFFMHVIGVFVGYILFFRQDLRPLDSDEGGRPAIETPAE